MKKQAGLTLIELLTTIAILVIVTAISIPNMVGWMSDRKLDSSARDILATIQFARLKAVKANAPVVVRLKAGSKDVVAFVDNGEGGGIPGNQQMDGAEKVIRRVQVAEGVYLNDITFEGFLAYDPRGIPTLGGGFLAISEEIHLKNQNKKYKGVRVSIAGNPTIISSNNGYYWD